MGNTPPAVASDKPVEVRLTSETIDYLEQRISASVKTAMSEVLKESINKDTARAFWSEGLSMARENATEHTGRLVIGGIRGLLSRGFMFLVLGSIVYAVGGWAGLAKLWTFFFGPGLFGGSGA